MRCRMEKGNVGRISFSDGRQRRRGRKRKSHFFLPISTQHDRSLLTSPSCVLSNRERNKIEMEEGGKSKIQLPFGPATKISWSLGRQSWPNIAPSLYLRHERDLGCSLNGPPTDPPSNSPAGLFVIKTRIYRVWAGHSSSF